MNITHIHAIVVFAALTASSATASITDGLIPVWEPKGELDRFYFEVLRSDEVNAVDPSAAWQVEDLTVEFDSLTLTFELGEFFPRVAADGHVFGAMYMGTGRWQFTTPEGLEQGELERLTGATAVDHTFTDAFLQFSPQYLEHLKQGASEPSGDKKRAKKAQRAWRGRSKEQNRVMGDHDLLVSRFVVEGLEHLDSLRIEARLDDLKATADSRMERQPKVNVVYRYDAEDPEEVTLLRYRVNPANFHDRKREILCHFPRQHDREGLSRRELAYKDATLLDVEHYLGDFELTADPETGERMLAADVKVRFTPTFRAVRAPALSLIGGHEEPDSWYDKRVEVRAVLDDSDELLPFVHSQGVLTVELPEAVEPGIPVVLRVVYQGDIMGTFVQTDWENPGGVRLVHYTLLNTFPWYPQNLRKSYDRYTYDWTFDVPRLLELASSGTTTFDRIKGTSRQYRIEEMVPSTHASVILGRFTVVEDEQRRWPDVKVFCHPGQRDAAKVILEETHIVLEFYEELLGGPYPFPTLDIAQMPYGVGFAQAPPGLVQMDGMAFLSKTTLMNKLGVSDPIIRELFLAHEIAHQWWAHSTASRSAHDYWMMETFCEYAAALYREATRGPEGYQRYLDHWNNERAARNTKRTTSLWLAATGRDGRRWVATAYGRGPLVMHDIRMTFGLETVVSVMRTILSNYWQGELATEDLRMVMEKVTGESFEDYFEQYIYGNEELPDRPLVVPEDEIGG